MKNTTESFHPTAAIPRRRLLFVGSGPVSVMAAVLIAWDVTTALALFVSENPDIVVLDADSLGEAGFVLCRTLRATQAGRDLPILVLADAEDHAVIAQAYRAGATDCVTRPLQHSLSAQRLEFCLRTRDTMRALRASERRKRDLLDALPDTVYLLDRNGAIQERIAGRGGAPHDQPASAALADILPPAALADAVQFMQGAAGSAAVTSLEFDVGEGEQRRYFEARLRAQSDDTFLIITRDATDRRRAEAQIESLAYYDTLTGLPNRQLFVRETDRALRAVGRPDRLIAILYLDLDRFKRINDNLGRMVGDALLLSVARRLQLSIRAAENQARVARVGGDEFVMLLNDLTDEAQAIAVANRILRSFGEAFDCGGHRFVVTPSIGIALYPRDAGDVEDLLVKADMAMYQAKDQGRNTHALYGESMAIRSLGRLELENDLVQAYEANDFTLHYQPKMDLSTGSVVGVEALLRWEHATRGWIPPDTFIPLAEETGLIVALGDWVIRETCKQLKAWADGGLGYLTIAVNVSVQQFAREDFVDSVLRALWQYGVKPHQLELEITESLLMRNVDDTTAALNRLRAAGLSLSIDDFGTGYSSLGYLRQFPVDSLKIDRSFVKDLHKSTDDAAICAAIIAIARELKLKVIAEGVETAEQLDFLRKHKCDQAQGYLISKPLSSDDLETLLRIGPHWRDLVRPGANRSLGGQ